MIPLVKTSLKLLLRNKGFLFFLLVTPMLSAIILSIKTDHSIFLDDTSAPDIIELETCQDKAVYLCDTSAFIVKVYDASGTDLSEYVLNRMLASGMFSVCRCNVSDMTPMEAKNQAKADAFDDRAGVILYLNRDFDQEILAGNWDNAVRIYKVSDDERQKLFETEITELLCQIMQAEKQVGMDSNAIINFLDSIYKKLPEKKLISLAGKEVLLNEKQTNQITQIGYAFAIITLGFLFCGTYVAHTVIEEQNNKVYTRVMLSKITNRKYFLAKFIVTLVVSLMQTFVLAVCLSLIKGFNFGISMGNFLIIIFVLGLIFSTLSLLLGVVIGDVMSSNYAAFSIWSISALLAGLYFPLDNTTAALKTLSYLMPQRWFMDAAKLLLTGDKSAYSMLFYITAAYLIIIISVGSVGLKMKRVET